MKHSIKVFCLYSFVQIGGPQKDRFCLVCVFAGCLTSESVQSTSLPLQGVDHVHGSDSLPLGVLGVGDGVSDDVLQEHLHNDSTVARIGMIDYNIPSGHPSSLHR